MSDGVGKPEVRNIAVWLDNHLQKPLDKVSYRVERDGRVIEAGFFDKVKIATHRK
jgi:hypothetical protein